MTAARPSILITDDDRDFRETLGGVLAPLGFRTLLAGDGEEALRIVTDEDVHVVLLDNNMPRLSGLETLRLVKKIKAVLPCILISARLDDAIREQAERDQVFDILSKPVSRGDLTSTVQQAIRETYGWAS